MRVSIALFLLIPFAAWADKDDKDGGKKNFDAALLRIADLNVPAGNSGLGPAFLPVGTDPLAEGSIAAHAEGQVEIQLDGAAANQSYSVLFCRFGFPPANCLAVGPAGGLATDGRGNGRANLDFPQTAMSSSWSGVFVLTRTVSGQVTYEFASGFAIRAGNAGPETTEITIEGLIGPLNAANRSFRIGSLPEIVTDNNTQFRGRVRQFSDLTTGMRVKVKALPLGDGRLWAREIETEGEPSRGRGRGRS